MSDANKLDQKREALVLNKNGGILREGPSEVYDELQKKFQQELPLRINMSIMAMVYGLMLNMMGSKVGYGDSREQKTLTQSMHML